MFLCKLLSGCRPGLNTFLGAGVSILVTGTTLASDYGDGYRYNYNDDTSAPGFQLAKVDIASRPEEGEDKSQPSAVDANEAPPCKEIKDNTAQIYYYVAPGGRDTNTGHCSAPFKTIARGVEALQPGNTLIITEGNYQISQPVTIEHQATAELPITIRGQNAVIQAEAINTIWSGGAAFFINQASHIKLENLTIQNAGFFGIRASWSNAVSVKNVTIDQSYHAGIFTDFSDDFTLLDSTITNTRMEHGVYLSSSGDHPVVRNNTFAFNKIAGLQVNADPQSRYCINEGFTWGADSICDGIVEGAVIENNTFHDNSVEEGAELILASVRDSEIHNNLIYSAGRSGIFAWGDGNGPMWGSKNNTFTHNTVFLAPGEGQAALFLKEGSTGNTLLNNILISGRSVFANYGALALDDISLSQREIDFNVYYRDGTDKVITVEDLAEYTLEEWYSIYPLHDTESLIPADVGTLFKNVSKLDFRPKTGSTLINAGKKTDLGFDRLNHSRPLSLPPDIGAFEHR